MIFCHEHLVLHARGLASQCDCSTVLSPCPRDGHRVNPTDGQKTFGTLAKDSLTSSQMLAVCTDQCKGIESRKLCCERKAAIISALTFHKPTDRCHGHLYRTCSALHLHRQTSRKVDLHCGRVGTSPWMFGCLQTTTVATQAIRTHMTRILFRHKFEASCALLTLRQRSALKRMITQDLKTWMGALAHEAAVGLPSECLEAGAAPAKRW